MASSDVWVTSMDGKNERKTQEESRLQLDVYDVRPLYISIECKYFTNINMNFVFEFDTEEFIYMCEANSISVCRAYVIVYSHIFRILLFKDEE